MATKQTRRKCIEIVDFVTNTWNLDKTIIDSIINKRWKLSKGDIKKYGQACENGTFIDVYKSFTAIVQHLITDLSTFLEGKPGCERFDPELWVVDGDKPITPGLRGNEDVDWSKPDLSIPLKLEGCAEQSSTPCWQLVNTVFELRRSEEVGHYVHTHCNCTKAKRDKRDKADEDSDEWTTEDSSKEEEVLEPPRKRRRIQTVMCPQDKRLDAYAEEALSCTSRFYFVGVLVEDFDVRVLYYDHSMTTRTRKFDFRRETGLLALILYGVCQCTKNSAGWDPYHSLSAGSFVQQGASPAARSEPLEAPVMSMEGSYFNFPPTPNGYGGYATFQITSLLSQRPDLVGRASSVYRVKALMADSTFSSDGYALKIYWPPCTQPTETEIIQRLRATLPQSLCKHLPRLVWQASFSADDLGLPSTRFKHPQDYKERVYCTFAAEYRSSLLEARSVDEFKQIWLDCVECHFHAYQKGRVLHQDISADNLMFYREDGVARGVLNDWDRARFADPNGEPPPLLRSGHHVGTHPFMAADLVSYEDRHYYRHDLESFFYVLIWVAVLCDFEKQEVRSPEGTALENWMEFGAGIIKICEFFADDDFGRIEGQVQPAFRGVLEEWIRPLRKLFWTARDNCHDVKPETQTPEGWGTYDGGLTFDTFMDAINVKPRSWKD